MSKPLNVYLSLELIELEWSLIDLLLHLLGLLHGSHLLWSHIWHFLLGGWGLLFLLGSSGTTIIGTVQLSSEFIEFVRHCILNKFKIKLIKLIVK